MKHLHYYYTQGTNETPRIALNTIMKCTVKDTIPCISRTTLKHVPQNNKDRAGFEENNRIQEIH